MDRANGAGPGLAASRAERFEDEKRRIVDSCFGKKDVDGSVLETYITHIRITEFATHPTTPPPPQARTPDVEKPRVIIVAVRKSGRVRMHKSKENINGTFSIGKTWNLDDLSRIESFTGYQTNPNHREWAGDTGFVVTLGKPYYWQAQSDKEKKFFIASLIKIYAKYTGGKMPELLGFDQRELDQVTGSGRRSAGAPAQPRPPPPPEPVPVPQSVSTPPPPPAPAVPPLPEIPRYPRTPPIRGPSNGAGSPAGSFDSNASKDRPYPPRLASQNNRSQESFSIANRSDDASSIPPRSRSGMSGSSAYGRFGEPREPSEPLPELQPSPQLGTREEKPPPERRRPPMDPSRPNDRDLVPPPLMSPAARREPVAPPPRSADRMSPRKPSGGSNHPTRSSSLTASLQESESSQPVVNSSPTPSNASTLAPAPLAPVAYSRPRTPVEQFAPPTAPPAAALPAVPPASSTPPLNITRSELPREEPTPPQPPNANSPITSTAYSTSAIDAPPLPLVSPDSEAPRSGSGPMITSKKSKGDIAGSFWKAASAASAFKPRPGGAAERLRQAQEKASEDGPDGITSVVPAPPRPVSRGNNVTANEPPKSPKRDSIVPEVKITVPNSSRPNSVQEVPKQDIAKQEQPPVKDVKDAKKDAKKEELAVAKEATPEVPRRSHVVGNDAKYLQTLGINPTLLDDRSEEFSKWLDYFGWVPGKAMRIINIDDLKTDLDREINKAQAGGWLARFEEEDERVDAIKRGIDVAMTECEELDNLLTLYSVELSTLSDDIAYIEAQGQGLQVQTANQKLLKKELESLLETCAITADDLQALRVAPLEDPRGLEDVESALVTLFRAMAKIDPSLGGGEPTKATDATMDPDQPLGLNTDYGQMRIVQEKKQMYMEQSAYFMRRLLDFMARHFDEASAETRRSLEGALSRKIDASHQDAGRDLLWKYSPLMLYARDVDLDNWNRLIQIYQDKSHPIYRGQFQNVITVSRKNAKKMTGDEAELLFTSQVEKQQEGVATTARKLTVKRSQTLARALRSPLADGSKSNLDKSSSDSRSLPYVVFAGVLDDLLPLVEMEQNFIVDFFHATTLEVLDFPDAVGASRPANRRGGDLRRHRLMEPDRELARRVTRAMEVIFSFLEQEIQRLMEWVIGQDPLQGIGVLASIEKKLAEMSQSNQDFLNTLLQKLQSLLEGKFRKFVDEQLRAIEETKVKINKRKGVISFFRIFPGFSTAVENMLTGLDASLGVRRTLDREYDRIVKCMFDSLKVIARENPAVGVTGGAADPEDKEALNFHILLIENMNHFLEETNTQGLDVLEEWKEQANAEYYEHMTLYLNAVMRRPLGKLLDFLENIEAQLQSGKAPASIAAQPSNSKNIFNKILGNYDSKEVRKGIEALRKRVEKHFGDADDPGLSRALVAKVLHECEGFYNDVESRIGRITTDVYGGDVLFEWPRADVKAAFR
ncbi:Exocyst complex component 1 [Paramyrothecium foliicola]|nr:Exocyst complex component 1 [Paramyrothecium foliicola]